MGPGVTSDLTSARMMGTEEREALAAAVAGIRESSAASAPRRICHKVVVD